MTPMLSSGLKFALACLLLAVAAMAGCAVDAGASVG
jgi:hypothetical protein